jgi:hypothetical protein
VLPSNCDQGSADLGEGNALPVDTCQKDHSPTVDTGVENLLVLSRIQRQEVLHNAQAGRGRTTQRSVTYRPFYGLKLMDVMPPWTPILIAPQMQVLQSRSPAPPSG